MIRAFPCWSQEDIDDLLELEDLKSPPLPNPSSPNNTWTVECDTISNTPSITTIMDTNQNPATKTARQKPPPRPPSTYSLTKGKRDESSDGNPEIIDCRRHTVSVPNRTRPLSQTSFNHVNSDVKSDQGKQQQAGKATPPARPAAPPCRPSRPPPANLSVKDSEGMRGRSATMGSVRNAPSRVGVQKPKSGQESLEVIMKPSPADSQSKVAPPPCKPGAAKKPPPRPVNSPARARQTQPPSLKTGSGVTPELLEAGDVPKSHETSHLSTSTSTLHSQEEVDQPKTPSRPPPPKASSRQKSPESQSHQTDPVASRETSPEVIPRTSSQGSKGESIAKEAAGEETAGEARLKKQPGRPQIPKRPVSMKRPPADTSAAATEENRETKTALPEGVEQFPEDHIQPPEASKMPEDAQEALQRPVAAPRSPLIKPRTKVTPPAEMNTEPLPLETQPAAGDPDSDGEGKQSVEDVEAISSSAESPALDENYESHQESGDVPETASPGDTKASGDEDVVASGSKDTESPSSSPDVSPSHSTPQPKPRTKNPPATQSSAKLSPKASARRPPHRPPQRPPPPSAKKSSEEHGSRLAPPTESEAVEPQENRDQGVAPVTGELAPFPHANSEPSPPAAPSKPGPTTKPTRPSAPPKRPARPSPAPSQLSPPAPVQQTTFTISHTPSVNLHLSDTTAPSKPPAPSISPSPAPKSPTPARAIAPSRSPTPTRAISPSRSPTPSRAIAPSKSPTPSSSSYASTRTKLPSSAPGKATHHHKLQHGVFTDPEFPPTDSSLFDSPQDIPAEWRGYAHHWLRPKDIVDPSGDPRTSWTVFRNPGPEDTAQGVLNNCWVVSALSVIAEQPRLLENIILTDGSSTNGAYEVRLCKDGQWLTIVVDDCLPCLKINNHLVFSKSHRKQLWVPLIEKAMAKLCGNYLALNHEGTVLAALSTLTGLPCQKIHLRTEPTSTQGIDKEFIWAQLLSFRELRWPMGAGTYPGNLAHCHELTRMGLKANHAYSILNIHTLEVNQQSVRLLRMRNPWGKFSWLGKWSDGDPVWQTLPRERAQLQPCAGNQGIFWIDFDNFLHYFADLDVCKYRPDWFCTRVPSYLFDHAPRQYSLMTCSVTSTIEVDINLYQPSTKIELKGLDIAVLCLKYQRHANSPISLPLSCELFSISQIQSVISCSGVLERGDYAILPLSFNHWDLSSTPSKGREDKVEEGTKEGSTPCWLALHSSEEVYCEEGVETMPGFLAESIFALGEKAAIKTVAFPGMSLMQINLKQACYMIVAVNEDRHRHFTLSFDASGSVNVFSTRGTFTTLDCIPPLHRQVVMVMVQKDGSQPCQFMPRWSFEMSSHNSKGQWGALNDPPIYPSIHELHAPRKIAR